MCPFQIGKWSLFTYRLAMGPSTSHSCLSAHPHSRLLPFLFRILSLRPQSLLWTEYFIYPKFLC